MQAIDDPEGDQHVVDQRGRPTDGKQDNDRHQHLELPVYIVRKKTNTVLIDLFTGSEHGIELNKWQNVVVYFYV